MLTHGWPTNLVNPGNSLLHSSHSMSTFCMLYAAMFDHVSLPAKLPFKKEEVGDLPKNVFFVYFDFWDLQEEEGYSVRSWDRFLKKD